MSNHVKYLEEEKEEMELEESYHLELLGKKRLLLKKQWLK
jgi:hypothetical protein